MSKGEIYRLVEAEGCRCLQIPLSLWPALTGILSDNRFQFDDDCWQAVVEEVINMPCACLPESYVYVKNDTWSEAGLKVIEVPYVPGGFKRRVAHLFVLQVSAGTVDVQVSACNPTQSVVIFRALAVPTLTPQYLQVDVFQVKEDFIKFSLTVSASSGTYYLGLWGEEWTV